MRNRTDADPLFHPRVDHRLGSEAFNSEVQMLKPACRIIVRSSCSDRPCVVR